MLSYDTIAMLVKTNCTLLGMELITWNVYDMSDTCIRRKLSSLKNGEFYFREKFCKDIENVSPGIRRRQCDGRCTICKATSDCSEDIWKFSWVTCLYSAWTFIRLLFLLDSFGSSASCLMYKYQINIYLLICNFLHCCKWALAKLVSIWAHRARRGTLPATGRPAFRIFHRLLWLEFLSDRPGVCAIW